MPKLATRRHAPRARHAARRATWRRVVTALGVIVAVLLVTGSVSAFVVYTKLNGNITKENVDQLITGPRPTKVTVPDAPEEPLNILLLGSDQRSGQAAENADVAGQRSDTTILLHLAADRQSAVLVSIPRDTMVPIPSCQRRDGTVLPAQSAGDVQLGVLRGRRRLHHQDRREAHQHPHRPPRRGRLRWLQGHGQRPRRRQGLRPAGRERPDSPPRASAKGTHTVKGQQALAFVRTRHGAGQRRRPVPHRPPAGVPRLDGRPRSRARACCSGRTGCCPSSARPPTRSPPTPRSAA